MKILLFIIYLSLFTWVVIHTRFFTDSKISKPQLIMLFLLKVIIGLIYGFTGFQEFSAGIPNDTWAHHFASLKETKLLFLQPGEYFTNIFHFSGRDDFASLFSSYNSYWNVLKRDAFIKLMSVFNCFSFGNYYINVIFYSYLTFFGVVAIYRVMKEQFKNNQVLLIISCFLVPSFIYWCSGLHKDGLTFLAVAIIIYNFYFHVIKGKLRFKSTFLLLAGFFLLFIFRNHILAVIIPALFAWALAEKWPRKAMLVFAIVYISATVCFFGLKYIHPALNFPAFVAEKQNAFNQLKGKTTLTIKNLEADAGGFIKNLPQAVSLSFFRPYLTDIYKPMIIPAYVEKIAIIILVILSIFVRNKDFKLTSFVLFVCFFVASVYLMIGYTQNNLGAIVRYRSFLFPLFTPLILYVIDWRKLKNYCI